MEFAIRVNEDDTSTIEIIEDKFEGMYDCMGRPSALNEVAQKYNIPFYLDGEEFTTTELSKVTNEDFNCMGFAFGQVGCLTYYADYSKSSVYDDVKRVIDFCESRYGLSLRVIDDIEELENYEYCVAFRRSTNNDDFHFIRQMDDGSWYEKKGCAGELSEFKDDIFNSTWYSQFGYTEYGGDTVLFAVEKEI